VRRPTLLISAVDDPFVPPSALPDPAALPPHVVLELTERGGHVGFVQGPPWRATSWAERRAVEFLGDVLAGAARC
jgi:predicted alpha/beta-fold hydrolase